MATSLIGRKLGKYQVVELVGRGGMATVYKGYQQEIDRYVAIKVLPPHPGQEEGFVNRFRQEARTVARLQHPHIISVYDYGDEDGTLYLVSPFLEGGTLSDRIRKGSFSIAQTETILRQIGQALDYAHRNGVIHRDIKPDNILLDREGHALLTDFGIAKIMEGNAALTATGGLVGTPAYMSPEQAQGLPVDYRTDLYSLGVVVYEMLTGKQPYAADTPMQVVFKHITAPVPRLSEVVTNANPQLDHVIQQALAKEPDRRFQSAFELIEAFSRAVQGQEPLVAAEGMGRAPSSTTATTLGDPIAPIPTTRLQETMVAQPAANPLVLLGGFAVLAIMIVVVLVILVNRPVVPATAEATSTTPPTQQIAAVPTVPTVGRASFGASAASGDTINLRVEGVTPPTEGRNYVAWLQDTENDETMRLGSVLIDPLGSGQLSYTDDTGAMLPARYNAVLLTLEDDETDTPSGDILYSGSIPHEVSDALNAILVDSTIEATNTTPEYTGSLYDGVMAEANIGSQHSGLAAGADNVGGMYTHAEHTINIFNGTHEDLNGDGNGSNPGRGYGVPFFLDRIAADLDAAANAPGATPSVQSQIELIRVCMNNARNWKDEIVQLETEVLASDNIESVHDQLTQATELADALVNGVDLNGNGQVEPFEGECGLAQVAAYGISVGNIDIVAGPLSDAGA